MTTASAFEREIREQPALIRRMAESGPTRLAAAAAAIRARAPAFAILAARGSSDNAARYAKYVWGAHNQLAVGLAAPALHTVYDRPPRMTGALVAGVSQSGQSPDVVAVVQSARRQGAITLAITNDDDSPLARAAELCLPIDAGEEKAVAASKTYTGQLMMLAMLSAAMADDDARWGELEALGDAMSAALEASAAARDGARQLVQSSRIAVLGRGYNLATAFETALKLKETSYVAAEPYSWADFLHGPIAMVEPGFPVVVVAPSGQASGDAPQIVERLRDLGAIVVVLSDRSDLLAAATVPLALPAGVPEWLSPIPAAVVGQLLALGLAEARGTDPDRPRGLLKVTRTR